MTTANRIESATIVKETEKAICLSCDHSDKSGRKTFTAEAWFPKSVIKQDGEVFIVADWFAKKINFDLNRKSYPIFNA